MARLSLVGGYLGAGKRTLLNSLLRQKQLSRVALVVNDFGSISIDSRIIAETSDDVIELSTGSMCCHLGESVDHVLSQLASREEIEHVICGEWSEGTASAGQLASLSAALRAKSIIRDELGQVQEIQFASGRLHHQLLGSPEVSERAYTVKSQAVRHRALISLAVTLQVSCL